MDCYTQNGEVVKPMNCLSGMQQLSVQKRPKDQMHASAPADAMVLPIEQRPMDSGIFQPPTNVSHPPKREGDNEQK